MAKKITEKTLKGYVCTNESKYRRAIEGTISRGGKLTGGIEEILNKKLDKCSVGDRLAVYDRLGGNIKKDGVNVKTGSFWDFDNNVRRPTPKVMLQFRIDGDTVELPEGKVMPPILIAKKELDKMKKDKREKADKDRHDTRESRRKHRGRKDDE